jgi:hypothetical protein
MKIAFGYKMGVGKDEACSYLQKKYGGHIISFAQPLYSIQTYAQKICGFPIEKDRKLLQFIGTEWARKKDPDVWIRLALQNMPKNENIFLSDLRFPNELEYLKKEGWVCIKIKRSLQHNRKGTGSISHESETLLDNILDSEWDFVLDNNKNLTEFHMNLTTLFETIYHDTT